MKISSRFTVFVLLLTLLTPTTTFAAGKAKVVKPKSAGRTTATIPNTILSGVGTPATSVGINGDFYIDAKNANLYGPKVKGKWPIATSLKGPAGIAGNVGKSITGAAALTGASGRQGETGASGQKGTTGEIGLTGLTGTAGANGINGVAGSSGPAGPTGSRGETGPTGSQGLTGLTGTAGANGINGVAGSSGPAGPTGSQGLVGLTGATGTAGANGGAGATGSQGGTGQTGNAGSTGPSSSYFTTVPTWSISTATANGTADSSSFSTLIGGRSYNFTIIIDGTFATSTTATLYFGMDVRATSASSTLVYQTFVSDSRSFINEVSARHYSFLIIGTVIVGVNDTVLVCRVTDVLGSTSTNAFNLTGKALINLVGEVG